jgi:TP901 family phage tail tape measure protein
MAILSTLIVALTATTTDFERGLKQAERVLDRTSSRIGDLGTSLSVGITAPIMAAGGAAVKMAVDFDDGMSKMSGLLGQSSAETEVLKNKVLELAGETAQSPVKLSEALVKIEEAGFRGQAAIDVLRVSAKSAAVGLGDLGSVAQIVTGAINAYGPGMLSAAKITAVMVDAVRDGHVSADVLAGSLGNLLPLASQLGIPFDQLVAAITSMTHNGMEAGAAAASLKSVLGSLEKPSKTAQEALAEMGFSAEDLREQIRDKGLLSALITLKEGLAGNEDAVTKLFPNMRTLGGVISLVGDQSKSTEAIFKSLTTATGSDLDKAFSETSNTAGFKFHQAMADVQVLLIRLGDQILPTILPLVQAFAGEVERLAARFAALDPQTRDLIMVIGGMAAAIGPALIGLSSMYSAASTMVGALRLVSGAATSATIWIAGLAASISGPGIIAFGLMAVAAGLIYSEWNELKADMKIIVDYIVGLFQDSFAGKLIGYISQFVDFSATQLARFGIVIKSAVAPAFNDIVSGTKDLGSKIEGGLGSVFDSVLSKAKQWAAALIASVNSSSSSITPAMAQSESDLRDLGTTVIEQQSVWERFKSGISSAGSSVTSTFNGLKARMSDSGEAMRSQMSSLANTTAQSMGAMTAAFAKGQENIGQFVQQMLVAIGELIAKILILRALTAVGLGGPFAAGFVGGMFAEGGRPPVGQVSIVGEKGPELFVPDTAGTIVPMTSAGSGASITVQNNITVQGIDLSSTDTARQVLKGLKDEVKSGTSDAIAFALRTQRLADNNSGRAA